MGVTDSSLTQVVRRNIPQGPERGPFPAKSLYGSQQTKKMGRQIYENKGEGMRMNFGREKGRGRGQGTRGRAEKGED